MADKTFNINHDRFEKLAPRSIRNLYKDEYFTDVTLLTCEGKQIKAHKVILSSSSEFFKNILTQNLHESPLIYLKDITYDNLQLIINFIYLGECEVSVMDVNGFIDVGKELQVEGLMEEEPEPEQEHSEYEEATDPRNLRRHINSVHDGVRYECQQCDHKATDPSTLRRHIKSVHDSVRYECQQCDHKATRPAHLRQHIKSVHDGVRYECQQCDHKATEHSHLRQI